MEKANWASQNHAESNRVVGSGSSRRWARRSTADISRGMELHDDVLAHVDSPTAGLARVKAEGQRWKFNAMAMTGNPGSPSKWMHHVMRTYRGCVIEVPTCAHDVISAS